MPILIILVIAALADLLVPAWLGSKYPGYNHFRDTISTLGTKESPVKKQENLNLILVGILLALFSFGQNSAFENNGWSQNLYVFGIFSFGIGCIIAGIFPEDSEGHKESVSGKIHGIASGIGFIFLILNPLWAIFIDAFAECRVLNVFLFAAGLGTFTAFILSKNKDTGLLKYTGLFQRLNLIVLYGCLVFNFTTMTILHY